MKQKENDINDRPGKKKEKREEKEKEKEKEKGEKSRVDMNTKRTTTSAAVLMPWIGSWQSFCRSRSKQTQERAVPPWKSECDCNRSSRS